MHFDDLINTILLNEEPSKEERIKALKRLGPFLNHPTNRFDGLLWEEVEGTIIESHHYETILDDYDYDGKPLYRTSFIFKLLTEDQEEVYGLVVFRGNYNRIEDGWDAEEIEELGADNYWRLLNEINS